MTDLREQLQQDLGTAYTLERELGGGGMSRVFLARDNTLGRQVVFKILPPEMAAAVSSQRFRREVQMAANLQHPHIVPLLASGETGGLPYFTMPFVKGESLKAHLLKVGELPLSEAIRILREVASALAYAHENNVVHRDIKPDNVLISGDSAVVTDFGVAKALSASTDTSSGLTSMGVALGTPAYMAPEQATADPHLDHRADIYALGVMAYEMITGTTPFANRTPQATLAAHVTEIPESVTRRRPNTPPGLAAIVMRCLEKRASDRPQSARELVNQLDALTTPSGGMTPTASYPVPAKRSRWMIPAAAAAVVAVLGLGAFAFTRFQSRESDTVAGLAEQKSIAVLPFKNMSGDPANEFFSDGLSEELLNVLAQVRGLRVAARGSSFQFKGKEADVREIGRKLGVETVLDGSVRRSGDQVRITAQLIDAKTGYQLWTETFDRKMDDVFAVQNEITRSIGNALNMQFGASRIAQAQGKRVSTQAYEEYLKGMFALQTASENSMKVAIGHFQEAARKDSGYAAAWAMIAAVHLNLGATGFMGGKEANEKAYTALQRALELDPELLVVQNTQVGYLRSIGEMEKSEAALKKVIQKNPNSPTAHVNYARILITRGDADGAVREIRLAMLLNPLSNSMYQSLGNFLVMAGKYKEGIAALQEAVVRTPTVWNIAALALALADDGQHLEAVKQAEKASSMSPDSFIELTRAYTYAKAGRRAEALKIANSHASKPDAHNYAFEMAGIYSALGDKDKAFEWLDKLETVQGLYVKLDPSIAGLRDDPRYQAVLTKWKLN